MDEELAYNITKAMYENVEELIAIHPAANDTTLEFSVAATPIPFHPGALRYLEEVGCGCAGSSASVTVWAIGRPVLAALFMALPAHASDALQAVTQDGHIVAELPFDGG